MSREPPPQRTRERLKLALIPVLIVVLWLVVRSNREEPVAELIPPSGELVAPARHPPADTSRVSRFRDSAITLEQALHHNPFATPAALAVAPKSVVANYDPTATSDSSPIAQSAADAANRLLEQVALQEVSVVSRGPNGWVAVVDGKPVSVGDWLDSRLQVIRIGPEGVTVSVQATPNE